MSDPSGIEAIAPRRPRAGRLLLAALSVPILLVSVSLWLGSEYAVTEDVRRQASNSFDRQSEAGSLIAHIADAESSQRGYVITGDPTFLAGYKPARAEVMQTFDALRTELVGHAELSRLLEQLRGLADRKFAEMDGVLAERDTGGLDAAVARVRNGTGKHLMDEMRTVSMRILAVAARERDARVNAYRARVTADQQVMWVGIAVVGALLLAAAFLIWRQGNARYRARLAAYSVAERNRSILDSTTDAIAILNPSGSIETINAAASAMLGYRPEELARRDVSVLIKLLDRPVTFHERIGLVDGRLANPYLPDRRILHRDGHEIPVDIALGVMRLPDGDHVVASVRDISERKRVEQLKDDLMSTVSH